MPPPATGKSATPAQVELLTAWIRQGAEYRGHWSFIRPERSPVPAVKHSDRVANPIDNFIFSRLEAAGLAPSPEADRVTLIRRATFDLTGLPPTPAELHAALTKGSGRAQPVSALEEKLSGGTLRLRTFIVEARDADVIGDEPISYKGEVRGWVTSGGFAHPSGVSVAIGYVPKEIADEMDATLYRSAFNPIIAEARDACHGLCRHPWQSVTRSSVRSMLATLWEMLDTHGFFKLAMRGEFYRIFYR